MIEKLKKKFVFINMALVSVVLIVVFASLCVSTYSNQVRMTMNALGSTLDSRNDNHLAAPDAKSDKPFNGVLTFSAMVSSDGSVAAAFTDGVSIDSGILQQAVERAYASDKNVGKLSDLSLRYMKAMTAVGTTKIAFADTSNETATLRYSIVFSLIFGGAALVAFFFISLLLSSLAIKPVKKSWEQQRQFIADASHELKTPLTVILANTDILLSHKNDKIEKQLKWVENTRSEASDMKKLVDDLLFLAKSDDNRDKKPELIPTNVSDEILGCILPFESMSFEKGVPIVSDVEQNVYAKTDAARVKQIAVILLDNACKYSEKGSPVSVSLKRLGGEAVIAVNNKGAVIAKNDLAHLFERFYRCEKSRAKEAETGGFGLGLSIAKSAAETINARLFAESDEINGTTFTLRVPC